MGYIYKVCPNCECGNYEIVRKEGWTIIYRCKCCNEEFSDKDFAFIDSEDY